MKIVDLAKIIDGTIIGNKDQIIETIKIDSRECNKNDCFIALVGKNKDGHDYLKDVVCNTLIVSKEIFIKNKTIIKVKDTTESLEQIAKYNRLKYDIPVIAITGSVGKTTTKELISKMLETKYNVVKNEKSYNNNIGLPLTLLKIKKNTDIAVVEIGTNNFGEVKHLSSICKPNVGIITNIGTSHIGNFKSKKNIFLEKKSMFDIINNGLIIVNSDDKYLKRIKTKNNILYKINYKNSINVVIKNIKTFINKTEFDIIYDKNKYHIMFNNPGIKLLNNVIIAIELALFFEIDIRNIVKVLNTFENIDNRLEIITKDKTTIINDCYNSSYESLISILKEIKKIKSKKVLIIGDILELGDFEKTIYFKLLKELKKIKNKEIILIGKNIGMLKPYLKCTWYQNNGDVIKYLDNINLDCYFLIKGSRKLKLEEITEYLKTKIDL